MSRLRALPPRIGVATDLITAEYEHELVASLVFDPGAVGAARQRVGVEDLATLRLRPVLRALYAMEADAETITLPGLVERMLVDGRIHEAAQEDPAENYRLTVTEVAELADSGASSARVPALALRVHEARLQRDIAALHEEAARDGARRPELGTAIEALEDELARGRATGPVGFTGERLLALDERETPLSPLPALFDPYPSLHIVAGRPKSGKTRLAVWLALHWCQGLSPWEGVAGMPGSRVLVLSAEQRVDRVWKTAKSLCTLAPESQRARWPHRMTVVAHDPQLGNAGRELLVLDTEGLSALAQHLREMSESGNPYGLVVLDSLSRLKPPATDENSNDDMSAWLDALSLLSIDYGVHLLLIHHTGHDSSRTEAVGAGRGASSISAVAQGLWFLDGMPGNPRQRVLKVQGNALEAKTLTFDVASESEEPGRVSFFRLGDPLAAAVARLDELLEPGESICAGDLARALCDPPIDSDDKPSGTATRLARQVRLRWEEEKLVEISRGNRNTLIITRCVEMAPNDDENVL